MPLVYALLVTALICISAAGWRAAHIQRQQTAQITRLLDRTETLDSTIDSREREIQAQRVLLRSAQDWMAAEEKKRR